MPSPNPMLHMVCGKIGAGKSTLCARLAKAEGTVRLSEDDWLAPLFGDQMRTGADYVHFAAKLRDAMTPHIQALLREGLSVVLDFPANTVEQREWMRDLLEATGADHQMHVLDVPDEICLARLRERNARGDHPFAPSEDMFHRFARNFAPPTEAEGFTVIVHRHEA
ncbi:AAA family ATPase [Aestuariivita boseongensis]|uniref:AAA family ATPase n=1 Tax=Aestuariivita boseongensis TaxID=1470562 RepID=UPI000681D686|nr:ATP-binding protein [Aestuariivita boseongensis]